jgi:WD40 repeat protein
MSQPEEEMKEGMFAQVGVDNPFPGLRPFKIEESHLFFGREGQSDEVLLKLSKNRFVGVIGPSGSGKSSFIYCGVLPILYGGFLTDTSPNWEVVVTRPGGGPIDNLSESLLKTSADYNAADVEDKKIKRTIVSTLLRSSSLGLVEAIQQSRRSADVNYLVLVDQFEELFRFRDGNDPNSVNETLGFINLLMEAVNYTDAPIYVAITMRSDFIGDCAMFSDLTRKINDSHYLIPQMTREQKRRAIEGPVAVGNAKIAPRLTQQLLNDLGDNPDQLPILQHSLMRTWTYWHRYKDYEDEPVDLKHYEAIGTMSQALSLHANEAYDELDEPQKRICEVIFKAITEKRGENFGIRRPTKLHEIASIADVSENEVIAVIEKFREPGRSLLTPGYGTPITSRSMVDISHESLMRIWVRLKNWVDDEADAVQMYLRLAEAASMYQVGKAGLWRPPDLQLALNWQAKHKPTLVWGQRYHPAFERTMIFLEYSRKEFETEQRIKELEAKRKLQRARTTAIILGSFLVVALIAVVYAFVQQTLAKEAERSAVLARDQAEVQRKAAEAAKAEADKQRIAAENAKAEADRQRIAAEASEKRAREQQALAEAAKKAADASAIEAKRQQGLAEKSAAEARIAEAKAVDEQKKAERLRYQAIAKAMGLKSLELIDANQKAGVAQQAAIFNTRYGGYDYENDVYGGLVAALSVQVPADGIKGDPLTRSLEGHFGGAVRDLEPKRGSNHIYSASSVGKIVQWSYNKGTQIWDYKVVVPVPKSAQGIEIDRGYQVYSIDISEDEKYLIAGGWNISSIDKLDNYVELYDLNNIGGSPKIIRGFVQDIYNLHFTPDAKGFFARDNAGHSIKYADLNAAIATEVIKSTEKINAIALSFDGSKLAGVTDNGNLIIWDVRNNYQAATIKVHTGTLDPRGQRINLDVDAVEFSPDGKDIIIGTTNGVVKIVRGSSIRELLGHKSSIVQIKYSHSGKFMATASKDQTIRLWKMDELNKQPIVIKENEWVDALAFTPDDEQIMAGMHQTVQTVELETVHPIRSWPTDIKRMESILCEKYMKSNLSQLDWEIYVGSDIPREKTCPNLPENNN